MTAVKAFLQSVERARPDIPEDDPKSSQTQCGEGAARMPRRLIAVWNRIDWLFHKDTSLIENRQKDRFRLCPAGRRNLPQALQPDKSSLAMTITAGVDTGAEVSA